MYMLFILFSTYYFWPGRFSRLSSPGSFVVVLRVLLWGEAVNPR
jgi:hypothetical protein